MYTGRQADTCFPGRNCQRASRLRRRGLHSGTAGECGKPVGRWPPRSEDQDPLTPLPRKISNPGCLSCRHRRGRHPPIAPVRSARPIADQSRSPCRWPTSTIGRCRRPASQTPITRFIRRSSRSTTPPRQRPKPRNPPRLSLTPPWGETSCRAQKNPLGPKWDRRAWACWRTNPTVIRRPNNQPSGCWFWQTPPTGS